MLKSVHWKHDHTSVKIQSPILIHVLSKYRITAQHTQSSPLKDCKDCMNCMDILKKRPKLKYRDGVYTIHPNKIFGAVKVYCDMTTEGGGWTVFQRRTNGSTNFFRNWAQYKNGFGKAENEYWLGNDLIHYLTRNGKQELRIDLEKFSGKRAYAKYSRFLIGNEHKKYKLDVGGFSGNAGDSFSFQNGMYFTTKDRDYDIHGRGYNCALHYKGGWWYRACHYSNLNGHYYQKDGDHGAKGISWYTFGKRHNSMRLVRMMVRPK